MYHPYFRGKQFDLLTIREMAPLLSKAGFIPIIEPVRDVLGGLNKALDSVVEADGRAIMIVNPYHGDLSGAPESLTEMLKSEFLDKEGISAGILLKHETSLTEALECYHQHHSHCPVFIHAGFGEAKALADSLGSFTQDNCHVFFENHCGRLYRKHFKGAHCVLLRDGVEHVKRNRDCVPLQKFSDLHLTFEDEGMNGFGDFLIVGDDFREGGGPAYAIAIHLTFIDSDKEDEMWIHHFLSERQDTPKDPAGKFAEALARMMKVLDRPDSKILETEAVQEFRKLHKDGHFPGLGHVKKLSMNHHIETLADYFGNADRLP